MGGCAMGGCVSLVFFFQLQKTEINDKEGYLCQAWRNVRVFFWSFAMKHDGGEWVDQKGAILAWRNYWTAPETQWLTLVEWDCPLNNGPKLAVG